MRAPEDIRQNVALAPLTTLGVGGTARHFVRCTNSEEIANALSFAKTRELPLFILGGGSNLVISDKGWPGLVLQVFSQGVEVRVSEEKVCFDVGAGVDWDSFVAESVSRNCAGIECLSGIPGTVGGTPVQNVGAYGQEVSETIVSILAFDRAEQRVRELQAGECGFGYRSSIFNSSQRERYIILRVRYALVPEGKPALRYADLQKQFSGRETSPGLDEVREAVRTIRATKGMLISPGDRDSRSAGSFFKNPVLSPDKHGDLLRKAANRGLQVPSYPALSQHKKVSAAWLVENSGFQKGYVKGNAAISSKHALALINRGGASAADIISLRDEIQHGVKRAWDILLETEPVFVGF